MVQQFLICWRESLGTSTFLCLGLGAGKLGPCVHGGTWRKEKSGGKFSEAAECRQTGANTVIQGQQCVEAQTVAQRSLLTALTLEG